MLIIGRVNTEFISNGQKINFLASCDEILYFWIKLQFGLNLSTFLILKYPILHYTLKKIYQLSNIFATDGRKQSQMFIRTKFFSKYLISLGWATVMRFMVKF